MHCFRIPNNEGFLRVYSLPKIDAPKATIGFVSHCGSWALDVAASVHLIQSFTRPAPWSAPLRCAPCFSQTRRPRPSDTNIPTPRKLDGHIPVESSFRVWEIAGHFPVLQVLSRLPSSSSIFARRTSKMFDPANCTVIPSAVPSDAGIAGAGVGAPAPCPLLSLTRTL
jgi:hypothetical protein